MPLIRSANQSSNPPPADSPPLSVDNPATDATLSALISKVTEILEALRIKGILQDTANNRDRTIFSLLSYSPANNNSYSYYFSGSDMLKIIDGNFSDGMMANAGKVFIHISLTSSAFINRLELYLGQFNGAYNVPRTFKIYSGFVTSDAASPLFSSTLANTTNLQTLDLSNVLTLDTPSNAYTFVFGDSGDNYVSINEMRLFGYFV
ncbi:MAG: hypothetical protein KME13_20365 [Myxacorys californica WJT36-NPBG1]|jgi:hypothetical protein|nr:hypothetical protein [Myxacorys californica WJT36-NPBG1]